MSCKSGISDPVGSKERTDNSQRRPLAKSSYRTILPEQAVMEFQASDMDLIYMRNPQDEDGNRLIRLDFQAMYA